MKRRLATYLLLTALCACSTACGEGSEEEEPPDVAALEEALVTAQCDKIFECCETSDFDRVFPGLNVETVEDCRSVVQSYTRVFVVPALRDSAESDRITLHDSDIPACDEAIRSRSCSDFEPTSDVDLFAVERCAELVEPALELSGFCAEDFECKTGFCSRTPGAAEGSCKEPPAEEEACLNGRCGEGLFCDADDTCRTRLGEGEDCSRNDMCASGVCSERDERESSCAASPTICQP